MVLEKPMLWDLKWWILVLVDFDHIGHDISCECILLFVPTFYLNPLSRSRSRTLWPALNNGVKVFLEENTIFINFFFTRYLFNFCKILSSKWQLISKQNCWAVASPKKRTKRIQDSILRALRTFFGRYYGSTFLFQD